MVIERCNVRERVRERESGRQSNIPLAWVADSPVAPAAVTALVSIPPSVAELSSDSAEVAPVTLPAMAL